MIVAVVLLPQSAQADSSRGDFLSVTGFSSTYSNLKLGTNSNDTAVDETAPTIDLEVALRVHTIFSFTVSWCHFGDPDTTKPSQLQYTADGFGVGAKIDLPGFLFIGDKGGGAAQHGKKHPVNTYIFGEVLKFFMTDAKTGVKVSTTAARDGFGIDIYPFNQHVYLATRFGLFNLLGVTYLTYAWGLGTSF